MTLTMHISTRSISIAMLTLFMICTLSLNAHADYVLLGSWDHGLIQAYDLDTRQLVKEYTHYLNPTDGVSKYRAFTTSGDQLLISWWNQAVDDYGLTAVDLRTAMPRWHVRGFEPFYGFAKTGRNSVIASRYGTLTEIAWDTGHELQYEEYYPVQLDDVLTVGEKVFVSMREANAVTYTHRDYAARNYALGADSDWELTGGTWSGTPDGEVVATSVDGDMTIRRTVDSYGPGIFYAFVGSHGNSADAVVRMVVDGNVVAQDSVGTYSGHHINGMVTDSDSWTRGQMTFEVELEGEPGDHLTFRYGAVEFDPYPAPFIQDDPSTIVDETGGLRTPHGLLATEAFLYVCSGGTDEILRYDINTGQYIDVFIGDDPATPQDESGGLVKPWTMALGPDGNIYVTTNALNEVLRYDGETGAFIDVFLDGSDGLYDVNWIEFTSIPEPASMALLAIGGLALLRRRTAS